jgi:hypothetical protein
VIALINSDILKKTKKQKKGRKQRTSGLKRGAIDIQRPFYFHGSLGNT